MMWQSSWHVRILATQKGRGNSKYRQFVLILIDPLVIQIDLELLDALAGLPGESGGAGYGFLIISPTFCSVSTSIWRSLPA